MIPVPFFVPTNLMIDGAKSLDAWKRLLVDNLMRLAIIKANKSKVNVNNAKQ
jgi:hypothetical protein